MDRLCRQFNPGGARSRAKRRTIIAEMPEEGSFVLPPASEAIMPIKAAWRCTLIAFSLGPAVINAVSLPWIVQFHSTKTPGPRTAADSSGLPGGCTGNLLTLRFLTRRGLQEKFLSPSVGQTALARPLNGPTMLALASRKLPGRQVKSTSRLCE